MQEGIMKIKEFNKHQRAKNSYKLNCLIQSIVNFNCKRTIKKNKKYKEKLTKVQKLLI